MISGLWQYDHSRIGLVGYANIHRLAGGHDESIDYDVAAKAIDSL